MLLNIKMNKLGYSQNVILHSKNKQELLHTIACNNNIGGQQNITMNEKNKSQMNIHSSSSTLYMLMHLILRTISLSDCVPPAPYQHPLWGQAGLLKRMLQAKDDSDISGVNNLASPAKKSEADIAQAGCGKHYLPGKFIAPVILHNSINHLVLYTENSMFGYG